MRSPTRIGPLRCVSRAPTPFHGEIEQELCGRVVGGHPIEIRKLKLNDHPVGCHIIFIPAGEKKLAEKPVAATKGSSPLTLGESNSFADLGGVINLTVEENQLRFQINLDVAMQTRLKISSKLLALARIVKVGQTP